MEKLLINADDFIGTRELRADMASILKDVNENSRTIVVTVQGKPAGVLLSVDEYISLLETIEDLENVELLADIAQSRREIAEGKGITLEQYIKERAKRKEKKSKRIA